MLGIILDKVDSLYNKMNQPFLAILYRAIISTGYFGLLRIGEVSCSNNVITARDVQIALNKKKIMFILRTSKTHGKESKPQLIKIISKDRVLQHSNHKTKITKENRKTPCPYKLLRKYLKVHGPYKTENEQFFIFRDGSPVHPRHISKCLKTAIAMMTLDSSLYSFHSLRIGRSTDLLRLGLSVESIKKLGRWKSNAVFKYLKRLRD